MRTLAMQASNDTNTASDRANLNDELTDLQAELTRIAEKATFNNQNLLEGTMTSSTFQIGHKAGETIALSIEDMSADSIGKGAVTFTISALGTADDVLTVKIGDDVSATYTATDVSLGAQASALAAALDDVAAFDDLYTITASFDTSGTDGDAKVTITARANTVINAADVTLTQTESGTFAASGGVTETGTFLSDISVTTRTNASDAVAVIDYALDLVSKERANLGAFQNRLEHAVSNMMNMSANTADARSVIADADYAQESSLLAKNQILQQAGTAMLAQANAQSQTVLSLLK